MFYPNQMRDKIFVIDFYLFSIVEKVAFPWSIDLVKHKNMLNLGILNTQSIIYTHIHSDGVFLW